MKFSPRNAAGKLALITLIATQLVGCSEYLSRDDRISPVAGEAVAANRALQVVDPWPKESFNTNQRTIGQRVAAPVERYRNGAQPASTPGQSGGSGMTAAASGATAR